MNTLIVNGVEVSAPHCPKCKKNDRIEIQYSPDGGWMYSCKRCRRALSYDEIEGLVL